MHGDIKNIALTKAEYIRAKVRYGRIEDKKKRKRKRR